MNGNLVTAPELDSPWHEDVGPRTCQFEHLLVGDLWKERRVANDAGVRAEDSVDIGVDLALIGAQRCGESDGGRVRSAPSEGGYLLRVGVDALEAGNDHDLPIIKAFLDPEGPDVNDLCRPVVCGRQDACLRSSEAHRGDAEIPKRHGTQGHRDSLAGRQQHVQLPRVVVVADAACQIDKAVRRIAHRGDNNQNCVSCGVRLGNPSGDMADSPGIRNRGPAVLLNNQSHAGKCTGDPEMARLPSTAA